MLLTDADGVHRVEADKSVTRGLKRLQSLVDQFLFQLLKLFFKLADLEVLARHAAEEGLIC